MKVFIESNKRNPSKYVAEERQMVPLLKQQRKLMNAGRDLSTLVEMTKEISPCATLSRDDKEGRRDE